MKNPSKIVYPFITGVLGCANSVNSPPIWKDKTLKSKSHTGQIYDKR